MNALISTIGKGPVGIFTLADQTAMVGLMVIEMRQEPHIKVVVIHRYSMKIKAG